MLSSAIGPAIGAVGSIAGGLLSGGKESGAANSAANAQMAAAMMAQAQQKFMYDQMRSDLGGYRQLGEAVTPLLGGLFNIPGYESVDPTATLQATPGYNWMMDQGLEGLSRYAASKGLTYSGPQMKSVTDWSQNLATNKAWQPYVNQLNSMMSTGQNAAAMTGNAGIQTGQGMANSILMGGQAQGQGIWNQALMNQNSANQWQQLLGLGTGLAMGGMNNWSNNQGTSPSYNWGAVSGQSMPEPSWNMFYNM